MTSHATVMSIRPRVILDGAATPAPELPAGSRSAAYVADGPGRYGLGVDAGEDFWLYLQLRATPGTVDKCLTHLDRQLQTHSGADVEIVGIGTDQYTVRVIIGVNLGESFRIKTRPPNVLAAYEFVQSLSADMANFWPQYLTGTPTDDERDLLASVVAAGAIRPELHAAGDLAFEPEREGVLDGHARWH